MPFADKQVNFFFIILIELGLINFFRRLVFNDHLITLDD